MAKLILFKRVDKVKTFPPITLESHIPYEVEEITIGDSKQYKIKHNGVSVLVSPFQIQNYIYSKKEVGKWKSENLNG